MQKNVPVGLNKKLRGDERNEKLLAVILAAMLVTSLLMVGVFASEYRNFAFGELDGRKLKFMAEVFKGRGLRVARGASQNIGKEAFAKSCAQGYDDSAQGVYNSFPFTKNDLLPVNY